MRQVTSKGLKNRNFKCVILLECPHIGQGDIIDLGEFQMKMKLFTPQTEE